MSCRPEITLLLMCSVFHAGWAAIGTNPIHFHGPSPEGLCYQHDDSLVVWQGAKSYCETLPEGRLANLPDASFDRVHAEFLFVARIAAEHRRNTWLDYRDVTGTKSNSSFNDSNGTPIPAGVEWRLNYPTITAGKECAFLRDAERYRLEDYYCTAKFSPLCVVQSVPNCPSAIISPSGETKDTFKPNEYFRCAAGYRPTALPAICQCNGQWSFQPPDCVPINGTVYLEGPSPSNRCYLVDIETAPQIFQWIESKAFCEGIVAGGGLPTFPGAADPSYEEMLYLSDVVSRRKTFGYWLAYRDYQFRNNPKETSFFTTEAGISPEFDNTFKGWTAAQPSGFRQDCLVILNSMNMHDAYCFGDHRRSTICHVPESALPCYANNGPGEAPFAAGDRFSCSPGYTAAESVDALCRCGKWTNSTPSCLPPVTTTLANLSLQGANLATTTTTVATTETSPLTTTPTTTTATTSVVRTTEAMTTTAEPTSTKVATTEPYVPRTTTGMKATTALGTPPELLAPPNEMPSDNERRCHWFGKSQTYPSCGTAVVLIVLVVISAGVMGGWAIHCVKKRTNKAGPK